MTPAEVDALCVRLQWAWYDYAATKEAAAALRQLVRERDEEIEECAKVADDYTDGLGRKNVHATYIAAAIRARKEGK